MGVDDVEEDGDAETVCGIDEVFEVFGSTEARAGGEEGGDVVTEGAVVRMFLDGHDLDGVIACGVDAWENVACEFAVGVDAGFLTGHTDVCFVDEGGMDF